MDEQEKELSRLRAEVRRLKRVVKANEEEQVFVDRIAAIARDAFLSTPTIQVPVFAQDSEHKEEVALLHISDVHIGKKTKTYNPRVFMARLNNLANRMLRIVEIQRTVRPIKKLVIVFNGDVIDAEAVYPSQSVDHIAIPVIDQIFAVGVPEFVRFLSFCLANFEGVTVYANRGNHGRQNAAKWSSSKSTNWDYVFHHALQAAMGSQDRLEWHIADKDWKQTFRILGHGFLATHGDMIKRYYSLPFYGQTRQAMRWQNAYQDKIRLKYFMFGHFHSAVDIVFNQVEILGNGSFVTDDPFAEEYLGVSSIPIQQLFGVHPRIGLSWRYNIDLR